MRTLFCLLLVVLSGCGSKGPSKADRELLEDLLRGPAKKTVADSIAFSGWDSTTMMENGKAFTVVRVKLIGNRETGEMFKRDVLIRYQGQPEMPLNQIANTAGDGWKDALKTLRWPE